MIKASQRSLLVLIGESEWGGLKHQVYRHLPSVREVHIGKDFDPEYPLYERRMKWYYRIPSLDPDWIPFDGGVDDLKLYIVDYILKN